MVFHHFLGLLYGVIWWNQISLSWKNAKTSPKIILKSLTNLCQRFRTFKIFLWSMTQSLSDRSTKTSVTSSFLLSTLRMWWTKIPRLQLLINTIICHQHPAISIEWTNWSMTSSKWESCWEYCWCGARTSRGRRSITNFVIQLGSWRLSTGSSIWWALKMHSGS